jgi:hypothetical protein
MTTAGHQDAPQNAALASVLENFPEAAARIRELFLQNPYFRSLCEDYRSAWLIVGIGGRLPLRTPQTIVKFTATFSRNWRRKSDNLWNLMRIFMEKIPYHRRSSFSHPLT